MLGLIEESYVNYNIFTAAGKKESVKNSLNNEVQSGYRVPLLDNITVKRVDFLSHTHLGQPAKFRCPTPKESARVGELLPLTVLLFLLGLQERESRREARHSSHVTAHTLLAAEN